MKYKIKYYYIKSDHIFASPEYDHNEIIDTSSEEELQKYIESKKDQYGNNFKKENSFGFDYISNQGAVKVEIYNPKIKKI